MPVYLRHNSPAHPIRLGLARLTRTLLFSTSAVFVSVRLGIVHPYKYKLYHYIIGIIQPQINGLYYPIAKVFVYILHTGKML